MGLGLIIAALMVLFFLRAIMIWQRSYYRCFNCSDIRNIQLQLHFLLWFILNPVARHSTRLNAKKHKMIRGMDFFTCSCHSGALEAKRGRAYRI